MWLSTALTNIARACNFFYHRCVRCALSYYQEQKKKWWENVIFTIHVLSRLTALLTWAASLVWTSAVTCCNIYREYHAPAVFTLSYVHRFCSSHHHSSCLSYETWPDLILVLYGWHFLLNFVLFCLTCNNIMHILPLPLCGLYSIRAQNGYGQHRPCKIVLLTLASSRGVTDLYLSWGIHIEHARTAYHETRGTEYQQPYRRCNSQTPYILQMEHSTGAPNERVLYISRSLQSWVSTTHRSYSQLRFFNIFIKITKSKIRT